MTYDLADLLPPSQKMIATDRLGVTLTHPTQPLEFRLVPEFEFSGVRLAEKALVTRWIEPGELVGWWVGPADPNNVYESGFAYSDGEAVYKVSTYSSTALQLLESLQDPCKDLDWATLAGYNRPRTPPTAAYSKPWSILFARSVAQRRGQTPDQFPEFEFDPLPPDPEGLDAVKLYWRMHIEKKSVIQPPPGAFRSYDPNEAK